MALFIKIVLIASFTLVFYQDLKERKVFWFLFPIIAVSSAFLMYSNMFETLFLTTIILNVSLIILLLLTVFIYAKLKLKTALSKTFGLGDGLLFFALAFTFSSISFFILFVFGLIFSLLLHLFFKSSSKFETVPLAGYLSFFFALSYLASWSGILTNLYTV